MTFLGDLRQGFRQLLHQPGFSAAAVGSLALGIGLTTALFCVVNAVLLRGSPVRQPDRLVEIYSGFSDYPQLTNSYPDYVSVRERADVFQGVAAHSWVRAILTGSDRPRLVTGESVSANYFDVLGITPALGRGFTAEEERVPLGAPGDCRELRPLAAAVRRSRRRDRENTGAQRALLFRRRRCAADACTARYRAFRRTSGSRCR